MFSDEHGLEPTRTRVRVFRRLMPRRDRPEPGEPTAIAAPTEQEGAPGPHVSDTLGCVDPAAVLVHAVAGRVVGARGSPDRCRHSRSARPAVPVPPCPWARPGRLPPPESGGCRAQKSKGAIHSIGPMLHAVLVRVRARIAHRTWATTVRAFLPARPRIAVFPVTHQDVSVHTCVYQAMYRLPGRRRRRHRGRDAITGDRLAAQLAAHPLYDTSANT